MRRQDTAGLMSKILISMMLRIGIDVFWERSVLICGDSSVVARLRWGESTLLAIRLLPSRELTLWIDVLTCQRVESKDLAAFRIMCVELRSNKAQKRHLNGPAYTETRSVFS